MKFGPVRDPLTATPERLEAMLADGWMPVLQFREANYTRDDLARLDPLFARFGDRIKLRFFHHGDRFDTSILSEVPHCRNLTLDALASISDFAPVASLPYLSVLRFSVYHFDEPDCLARLDLPRFTSLGIGANAKRSIDLAPLERATALETLFVQGLSKGIERIAHLPQLNDVGLSGFAKAKGLAFLNSLPRLEKLLLILGTRRSIADLDHPGLTDFSLIRVSLLEELGPLNRFRNLRRLVIDQQRRLETIDLTGLQLEALKIIDCKGLREITGLDRSHLSHALLPRWFETSTEAKVGQKS